MKLSGFFEVNVKSDIDQRTKEMLIKKNTLAILFPYLRSLITTITANAGVKPIILPPININALLEEKERG